MQPTKKSLLLALLPAAALLGCGPTLFAGQADIKIVGALPPPPIHRAAPKRVQIVDNKIVIREKIQFELNKSRILEESHGLLNEVVGELNKNPGIKKVRVEGHASSDGPKALNRFLSRSRAIAVMKYLVGAGIAAERLDAEGYGDTKPIGDNGTKEGREQNRRVEFNILEQDAPKKKTTTDKAEKGE